MGSTSTLVRLRKEAAFLVSRVVPIRVRRGLSTGMRLYGKPFYNRRTTTLKDEEILYRTLDLRGKVVLEAGANLGLHTYYFARRVGSGRVLAFEPNPVVCDLLRRNLAVNGLDGVEVVQAGLSSEPGELHLVCPRYVLAQGSFEQQAHQRFRLGRSPVIEAKVRVTTIDDVVRDRSVTRVDFVKIDTEGYEPEVVEGMPDTLERLRPRVYFEIHGLTPEEKRDDLRRVLAFVIPRGYDVVALAPGAPAATLANVDDFDRGGFLCLPEEDREKDALLRPWRTG